MVVIKNGCGLLGLRTLKSALSQEWVNELADFLHTDISLWKLKVTLRIIGGCGKKWLRPKRLCILPVIWLIKQIDWMIFACW